MGFNVYHLQYYGSHLVKKELFYILKEINTAFNEAHINIIQSMEF